MEKTCMNRIDPALGQEFAAVLRSRDAPLNKAAARPATDNRKNVAAQSDMLGSPCETQADSPDNIAPVCSVPVDAALASADGRNADDVTTTEDTPFPDHGKRVPQEDGIGNAAQDREDSSDRENLIGGDEGMRQLAMIASAGISWLRPAKTYQKKVVSPLRSRSQVECGRHCGSDGQCDDPACYLGCDGVICRRSCDDDIV